MSKTRWSEFEVQAVAWNILRAKLHKHYHVRGEYRLWFEPPDNDPESRPSVRLDIVIINKQNDEITAILQVKKNKTGRIRGKIHRIHQSSYLSDIPLIVIEGMNDAIHIMDTLKSKVHKLIVD